MQTYSPIRGMTVCVSGGEYVKREDADTEIAALKKLVSVFNQRDGDKDAEIAALKKEISDLKFYLDQIPAHNWQQRVKELEATNQYANLTLAKWKERMDNQAKVIAELEGEIGRLREALERIASGMGADLLGTVSLSRDDMQEIAREVLKEPLTDRLRGRTKITDEDVLAAPNDSSTCPGGVSPNCEED